MRNLSQSDYHTDRVVVNTLRCAARTLGLPGRALLRLPPGELRRLVKRARRRAERELHRANLAADTLIVIEDLIREGRLP